MIVKIASAFFEKQCDNICNPDVCAGKKQTQGDIVMSDSEQVKVVDGQPDVTQIKVIDEQYILKKYDDRINYYWKASRSNKNAYRRVRLWTVILGSLVTLISSISAAEFVQRPEWLRILFAVATPVIAASLTIISGLGQNFHWGSTWRDMVINAVRLEKERDQFLATKQEKRNFERELDTLNLIVLEETRNFFQRVLDSEIKPKEQPPRSE